MKQYQLQTEVWKLTLYFIKTSKMNKATFKTCEHKHQIIIVSDTFIYVVP